MTSLLTVADESHYAIAIHTASPELGLAISNFADDTRWQTWMLGRDSSNYLHRYLAEFIQPQTWADLAFIAVAQGPGGFTGTRLGVVTARTLAQQLHLPLFAVSTLAAVAWTAVTAASDMAASEIAAADIAVQMPAQRGAVHAAIYAIEAAPDHSWELVTRLPDTVLPIAQWQETLDHWQRPYRQVQAETGLGATVQAVLTLAERRWQKGDRPNWAEVLPVYGQSPV